MLRSIPSSAPLPYALYRAEQVRAFDRAVMEDFGIAGAELMERAGQAAYRRLRQRWPGARRVAVLCGAGNNAGDGYVVARLAQADGLSARVLYLGDRERLRGDARAMATAWQAAGGDSAPFRHLPENAEVLVDALLGTGLERAVEGDWARAVEAMNAHRAPVLALDIPTGLHADSGRVLGTAVRAAVTVSFIALKQGLCTGAGPECCGDLEFDALAVPAAVYGREILSARRLDWHRLAGELPRRRRDAHKGDFGHVLVVGGAPGMAGAARLAGEGALRAGAGLVTVATHPRHAACLHATRPELMVHDIAAADSLEALVARATVAVVGPGLGEGDWGRALLARLLATELPLVVDAEALNRLAEAPVAPRANWILTPHPGEAARLLETTTAQVQADRFLAVRQLQERWGGTLVLKGAGTLIGGPSGRPLGLCSQGNPGMASGGMGDVLAGMIAALLAQGLAPEPAAECGVCLHAAAGDAAAAEGERGLLASDLIEQIRPRLQASA